VKKILNISSTYPRLILVFLVLVTVFCVTKLPSLKVDISAQSMMVKTDPLWKTYQKTLKTFGSDNVVILFFQDKKLFTAEKLSKIKATIKSIEKLDFVTGSSSLFNTPNVREIDDYIITRPFLDEIPEMAGELESILAEAISNPLVAKNLVSVDAKTLAVNIYMDGAIHYPGRDAEITLAIERELEPLSDHLDVVFQMGSSYVRDAISKQIQHDQKLIIPAALAI